MTDDEPQPRAMLDRCRSTCRWRNCTGTGSAVRWAHPCQFAPPPPLPSCNVCGEQAVDRFVPGWRCADHTPEREPWGWRV